MKPNHFRFVYSKRSEDYIIKLPPSDVRMRHGIWPITDKLVEFLEVKGYDPKTLKISCDKL